MHIVIIGGGFAGINLAKALTNEKGITVTLVDKNNYNFFPPLIYQVATAFLEPSSISYPFRKFFAGKKNLQFRLGEFLKVIPTENKIILNNGELVYDQLVFATGAETSYFGMENVRKNAIPMKTLNDAIEMRNTLLKNLEKAAICKDIRKRRKLLTIVVAGGGPTGVEVSGMFAEMRKSILIKEYPELDTTASNIYLVDGGDIFAIGDTCIQLTDENFSQGHPQVAQVAIQQGLNLAENFKNLLQQKALKPFIYKDKGSMAIIGKNKAVVDLPKPNLHFKGFFAWMIWLFVHLMSLITYRNRINTFYHWMIAYFSKDQSLRMIIRPDKRIKEEVS